MTLPTRKGATSAPEGLSTLIELVNLGELVERYSGPGRRAGRTLTFRCPNPSHPDNSPSFTVTTSATGRQSARCWSQCGWQGDALDLVEWLEGLSTGDAANWLRNYLGKPQQPRVFRQAASTPSKPKRSLSPKPEDTATAPTDTEAAARFMGRYLSARGWPASVVDTFGLSVVIDSTGAARIRHPYFVPNASGEWTATYWQDRGGKDSRSKWLSPKGGSPVLYNLRSLERDNLAGVVICEGPADTVTASLALEAVPSVAVIGCPGASAWRPEWAQLVTGLRVVVAADNDPAGQRLEEAVRLSVGQPVALCRFSAGDLTDTAREHGLDSVKELLLGALRTQPDNTPRTFEDTLSLLLRFFPEGQLEEVAS